MSIPGHEDATEQAVAAMVCPCDFQAVLLAEHTPEDRAAYDDEIAAHVNSCDLGWVAFDRGQR
jgi:hypothetical protein